MKHIWAPWRMQYIRSDKVQGCILCAKPTETTDEENYILYRGKLNYVMLNAFPYNPGHLMISPYRHIASPEEMTKDERHDHYDIVSVSLKALRQAFGPQGINMGMNLGRPAGAGIDDHCHTHLVPRWNGDTNFITVMGDIRVVPEALADSYNKLKQCF